MNLLQQLQSSYLAKQKGFKQILPLVAMILGLALPFILVAQIGAYGEMDTILFNAWADCWGQKIYLADCQYRTPNYPVLGLAYSAGVIHVIRDLLGITNTHLSDTIFRYYLAIFDALNFLLLIWLGKLLKFRNPILISFLILCLPSTWVGGAIWGQIDGISLSFCLLASICFFQVWLSDYQEQHPAWKKGIWLCLAMLNLSCFILIKQLAIFSLPFFLLLVLITTHHLWIRFRYRGMLWLGLAVLIAAIAFRSLDSLLEVPAPFHGSSYWFVWQGGGSDHGNKISGNGFNLWMFLGREMLSSSRIPFLTLRFAGWQDAISPMQAGIVLYLMLMAYLLGSCLQQLHRWMVIRPDFGTTAATPIFLIVCLCFFHGLSYLGFNVLLTGTHERYLYTGYPFLLIAVCWLKSRQIMISRSLVWFCCFSAFAYGCFVFSVIGTLPELLFAFKRHEFLASIHLLLLVLLLGKWQRLQGHRQLFQATGKPLK